MSDNQLVVMVHDFVHEKHTDDSLLEVYTLGLKGS